MFLLFRLKMNLIKELSNGVVSSDVSSRRDIDAIDIAVNDPENARLLFHSVNSVIQICTKRNRTRKQQSMIDELLRIDIFIAQSFHYRKKTVEIHNLRFCLCNNIR